MAQKNMKPGRVNVTVDSGLWASSNASPIHDLPGGLYPMQTRSYVMDDWRVKLGWPVEVPKYDIRARSLISADGDVFSGRDDNTQVTTGALLRWVADANYYDEVSLKWKPLQNTSGHDVVWTTSVEYAPVLIDDYEYRIRDERFFVNALNFDSDTKNHMWTDLATSIGSSQGYSVIMVMSPNSTFGNNIDVPYNGVWCPGRATPAGDTFVEDINPSWIGVELQGRYLYVKTPDKRERVISVSQALDTNAPLYLCMVFSRPETVLYVGSGPSSVTIASIETGDQYMDDGVVLGRSTNDVLHTADMALMDLGIYADRLTKAEVTDEFSMLAACYGGS